MRKVMRSFIRVLPAFLFTAAAVAQTSPYTPKMGLWEITMTPELGGRPGAPAAPPGVDLSTLTPEQRAMLQQRMAGRGGGAAGGITTQVCMTPDSAKKGAYGPPPQPNTTCTQKVIKETATSKDFTSTCTGETQSVSEAHIEFESPTSIKMTLKSTTTLRGGQPMTMTMTMVQKWVKADCGTIK